MDGFEKNPSNHMYIVYQVNQVYHAPFLSFRPNLP